MNLLIEWDGLLNLVQGPRDPASVASVRESIGNEMQKFMDNNMINLLRVT